MDPEEVQGMRELCLGTNAECKQVAWYLHNVTNAAKTNQYLAIMSNYEYFAVFANMLRTCNDLVALEHAGYCCDPCIAEKMTLESPEDHLQDAAAQTHI